MIKAEELAKVAFPDVAPDNYPSKEIKHIEDLRRIDMRYGFRVGYHQAEKDLKLTWEDLKMFDNISDNVYAECDVEMFDEKEYYQEILKRFKNLKK